MKTIVVLLFLVCVSCYTIDLEDLPDDPQLVAKIPDKELFKDDDDTPFQYSQFSELQQDPLENKSQFRMEDQLPKTNNDQEYQFKGFTQIEEQKEDLNNKNKQLNQAVSILQQSDDTNKLNWKIFAQALTDILQNIQNQRSVEQSTFDQKKALSERISKLHERNSNKIKVDIAKNTENVNKNLDPYKKELSDTLKFREQIYSQIKDSTSINEDEKNKQKKSLKVEMDEVSQAQQTIDEIISKLDQAKNDASMFVQIQEEIKPLHQKMSTLLEKHSTQPISELVNALAEMLTGDFKQRSALKDAIDLLQKLRALTLDYKMELIDQGQKQEKLYEQRKEAIENDKATNDDIYSSKMEQYSTIAETTDWVNQYIKVRQRDLDYTLDSLKFLKNLWATEQGIQTVLDGKLIGKAGSINDAIKQVGQGIQFEGEMIKQVNSQTD